MKTGIITFALLLCCNLALSQATERLPHFDESFVHNVYFWLKNPDNSTDRAAFEKGLRTFLDNSAYAKTKFVGTPPKAIRDVVDDSYTYNMIVTFASEELQEKYQNEEAHLKFIADCKHLWEKVVVYDALGLR